MKHKSSGRRTPGRQGVILIVIAVCLVTAGITGGVTFSMRRSAAGNLVPVVSVAELAEYGYGGTDETETMEGIIVSEAAQSVYLSRSMPVKEVKVKKGQKVRKGDILLVYNTGKAERNVEKRIIERDKIMISIEAAERNLQALYFSDSSL